jgi:hypothetical protein
MGQEPKEEGPAEEAPEEEARPSDQEPLAGYTDQNKRKLQIFEVDGYLRLRTDYMHNFFMGQGYTALRGSSPTAGRRWACRRSHAARMPASDGRPSPRTPARTRTIRAWLRAQERRRREPAPAHGADAEVTDNVRVHAQIDILDNTFLARRRTRWPACPGTTGRRRDDGHDDGLADLGPRHGADGLPGDLAGPARGGPQRTSARASRQARLG